MLYENYHNKISQLSHKLAKIVKYMALIVTVLAVITVTAVALLAAKGLPGDVACATEVTYGEPLKYKAKAFLSSVRYEFKASDSEAWTDDVPDLPGTYQVRAVGVSSFGNDRYGDPSTFVINPRPVRVWVVEEDIVFGDVPTAKYDPLQEGDTLSYEGFTYDDITASSTQITPILENIMILDADGNDVTFCYDVQPVVSTITFQKRPLTITVESVTEVYDGTLHTSDQYEITAGSTGTGDNLIAVFSAALTTPGSADNTAQLTIYHWQDGTSVDVTHQYELTIVSGTLTVDKRPLYISTESSDVTYTGLAQSFIGYEEGILSSPDIFSSFLEYTSTILDGHRMVFEQQSFTDAGTYENIFDIRIVDELGNDVTEYYSLYCSWGTIQIDPKPLTIQTDDGIWVYDGNDHSAPFYVQEGLLEDLGHHIEIFSYPYITDAGTVDNLLNLDILDADGDVISKNYDVQIISGKLTVEKYPVTITTGSNSWEYDALPHADNCYAHSALPAGHSLVLCQLATITNAGSRSNDSEFIIVNQQAGDVTYNFDITYEYGTLTVTRRPINIRTGSAQWVYDGESHDCPSASIYGLLGGQFVVFNAPFTSITDVGSVKNIFTVDIYSQDEAVGITNLVTDNYDITYEYGTLTVTKRPITIQTLDAKWIYDGESHDHRFYDIISEMALADGHALDISDSSSIQNVGTTSNRFTDCSIRDEAGNDRTANYEIAWIYGTLRIDPRPIEVRANDVDKVYDGTPLYADGCFVTSELFSLVDGHSLTAKAAGSRIDIGTSPATPIYSSIRITDGNGEDVTSNYEIYTTEGNITVHPIRIIVTSNSDTKYYDGTPLINKGYSVKIPEGNLLDGHELQIEITGSITDPGTEKNTIIHVAVIDQNGNPISDSDKYYSIETREGDLQILPNSDSGNGSGSGDGSGSDDGSGSGDGGDSGDGGGSGGSGGSGDGSGSGGSGGSGDGSGSGGSGFIGGGSDADDNIIFGTVKNDRDGLLYLRQYVYGDFTGRNWNKTFSYGKNLPNGLSYNYLTTLALFNSGSGNLHTVELNDMRLSMLPYYMGLDGTYNMPGDDISSGNNTGSFTMTYYDLPDISGGFDALKGYLGEYASYEEEYRKFVYQYYRTIDDDTRAYMQGIIDAEGFSLDDPDIVLKIARYIQNAATYNLDYDVAMDNESNIVIAFLEQYKEGKCTHYASAATLLYRALGIPARYVEGFMIQTEKDTFVEIKNPGHAWVEVYIDGVGWVQVEVTGSSGENADSGEGELPPEKPKLTIIPAYASKIYDGNPLIPDSLDAESLLALQEYVMQGYTYSYSLIGSQLEVGKSTSSIGRFCIFDPNGNDVTDQFDIELCEGILEVFPADKTFINITLYQLHQYHNGSPLFYEEGDYKIELPSGFAIVLELNISLLTPGQLTLSELNSNIASYVTYTVYRDGVDVTSDFILRFVGPVGTDSSYIPIRIEKRSLQLTSASQAKFDDGTPLTNSTVTISSGSLIDGHTLVAQASGSIDAPGSILNTLTDFCIYDSNGNDVTDCYQIDIVEGTLTILNAPD